MADEFDPATIGVQLDRAEEAGTIDTATAETLRKLVRREAEYLRSVAESERRGCAVIPARNAVISFGPSPAEPLMPLCLDIESERERLERNIAIHGYGVIQLDRSQKVLNPRQPASTVPGRATRT